METIVYSISFILIISTILPKFNNEAWWIRIFDFVRFQIFVISIPAVLSSIFFLENTLLNNIILAATFVCLLVQAKYVLPYTFLSSKEVKDISESEIEENPDKLSLMVCNVYMYNSKFMKVVNLVEKNNPDVLLLLEPNNFWTNSIEPFLEKYSYRVVYPKENTYGMALYSKKKLSNVQVRFLTDPEIPSIKANINTKKGNKFDLYCVHPRPPVPTEADSSLQRDVELIKIGEEVKESKRPTILAGDLNDVAWSKTTKLFQKISKTLDPRKGRGFFSTYNADILFFRWPLDHIFHSKQFKLSKLKRLPHVGSDHFPIFSELVYLPDNNNEKTNKLNEDDKQVIKSKLEEFNA